MEIAARLPVARPPTKAMAPIPGVRTSASPIWAPSPERSVTGKPTLCMSAWAKVRQ